MKPPASRRPIAALFFVLALGGCTTDDGSNRSGLDGGADAGPFVELVIDGQARPTALAISEGRLFWVNEQAGTVVSCPTFGSCSAGLTTIADDLETPRGLAVYEGRAYFTVAERVLHCPTAACDPAARVDLMPGNSGLDVDANGVVAALFPAQLLECELDGACDTPAELTFGMGIRAVTLDGPSVYVARWGTRLITHCQRNDCEATNETLIAAPGATQMAVTDAMLYWAESNYETSAGAITGRIVGCPVGDCVEPPTVVLEEEGMEPFGVAVEDSVLFWSDYDAGTIRRHRL